LLHFTAPQPASIINIFFDDGPNLQIQIISSVLILNQAATVFIPSWSLELLARCVLGKIPMVLLKISCCRL